MENSWSHSNQKGILKLAVAENGLPFDIFHVRNSYLTSKGDSSTGEDEGMSGPPPGGLFLWRLGWNSTSS